jgi:predicted nucleic acid-binding protein
MPGAPSSDGDRRPAIIDASCLCCFARARRLDVLSELLGPRRVVVATAVLEEVDRGVALHPELRDVRRADWFEEVHVDGLDELKLFASYVKHLGAGERDIGECSSLAWAEAHGAIVVLDDQTAVNIARKRGVEVRRSLALVSEGLRRSVIRRGAAESLVDELQKVGGARFPCTGRDFLAWAEKAGLLPL